MGFSMGTVATWTSSTKTLAPVVVERTKSVVLFERAPSRVRFGAASARIGATACVATTATRASNHERVARSGVKTIVDRIGTEAGRGQCAGVA